MSSENDNLQNQSSIILNHNHQLPSTTLLISAQDTHDCTHEPDIHMYDHAILHCNTNSMYKQRELNNATSDEHVISDTLYKHILSHKINCLVDTRLSPEGKKKLHHSTVFAYKQSSILSSVFAFLKS